MDRVSRLIQRLFNGFIMKWTCGSVRSSLSAPTQLATIGSEATQTISSALSEGDCRGGISPTASVKLVRGLDWTTGPTYVNRRSFDNSHGSPTLASPIMVIGRRELDCPRYVRRAVQLLVVPDEIVLLSSVVIKLEPSTY